MGTVQTIGLISPKVVELAIAFQARNRDALQAKVDPWWKTLSGFTSTDALRLKFPIRLGSMPGFREWAGERDVKNVDLTSFFIDSKPWERTIGVPLDVALKGEFAAYLNEVDDLRIAGMMHPNRLIATLLANGASSDDGWDGVPFFSASHPVDLRGQVSGVFANTVGTKPFNRASLAYAKAYFRGLKAPDGKTSLGLRLTHVMLPTALEDQAVRLSTAEYLPNIDPSASAQAGVTESNIHKGTFTPIIAPELDADSASTWYALALNLSARPFESQARGAWDDPDIKILGDGTEHATKHNEILYAGKLFGNAGYAIPHTILKLAAS